MARARNIKPSFFANDLLGEMDPVDRLFFIGLWTVADYKGCVEFRPKKLKVQILPYDNCDVEKIANNLEESGFVRAYSVEGKNYLKIMNFEKHQNPHKNEREKGSEIPDIPRKPWQVSDSKGFEKNPDKIGSDPDNNGIDPADSLNLIPDSPLTPPQQSSSEIGPAEVRDLYNEILSDVLPRSAWLNDKRKRAINARIREDPKRRDPGWWRNYFEVVRETPKLTGAMPAKEPGGDPWVPNLEWLVNPNNMLKVIEGNYDKRAKHHD